ncbi:MAG TPA: Holliday junction resolvase RuvX [Candidatus Cloacimonas sp.]|nr:putative pre6S rRNA nuclease [Candidatus Cloacimonadota bacterium]HCX73179.1 Holliday junction resolvase RuvX [Candidatus Cloacimonas sp.]
MEYSRIMGIDFGTVRVGIALSDPMQIIARPYVVLANDSTIFTKINKIISEKNVSQIVLGLPVNLSGEDTEKTKEVREFAKKLKKTTQIPLTFSDERYTSVEANQLLEKMGYSIRDSRKVIDKVAAALILKGYLETVK